jgi:hypothetical protein
MLMSFMKIEGDLGRLQHLIEIKPYIIHLTTNTYWLSVFNNVSVIKRQSVLYW